MTEISFIRFGLPGHDGQYVLHVRGFGFERHIPKEKSDELQALLPEWQVDNRGTMLVIAHRGQWGHRDDHRVVPFAEQVFETLDTGTD